MNASLFPPSAPPPPPPAPTVVRFFAPGVPAPGGSKTARAIMRRDGRPVLTATGRPLIVVNDAGKRNKEWRAVVALAARQAMRGSPALDGPLWLRIRFVVLRPRGHYGSGRNAETVRASAPRHPTTKPDLTKLTRSTEDALSGIVWRDDATIVRQELVKTYGDAAGALIEVGVVE